MNKELLQLLKKYQSIGLTNEFIEEAYRIMEKDANLGFYLRDLDIRETEGTLGEYDRTRKTVIINREGILDAQPKYGLKTNIDKKILTLEVLRHEIEHARHLRSLYAAEEGMEATVIRYSLRDYALNHGLETPSSFREVDPYFTSSRKRESYEIDPGERLAEIRGWEFISKLLTGATVTTDLSYARSMLYYSYTRGYINGGYLRTPTYSFLLNLALDRELEKLKERVRVGNYSFDTRITCGLPITNDELNNEVFKKIK